MSIGLAVGKLRRGLCVALMVFALPANTVTAEPIRVAVAANFRVTLIPLLQQFSQQFGIATRLSSASSGTLYAQIINGAPVDLFLSADALRPQLLQQRGLAIAGSRQTYAHGKLVLWIPKQQQASLHSLAHLKGKIAIANPKLAPYGMAAVQVLQFLNLQESLDNKLVVGNNVVQTFQFVASANASAGFVALSLLLQQQNNAPQARHAIVPIPSYMYKPIRQQLVQINRPNRHQHSEQLVAFLLSAPVQQQIQQRGYAPANIYAQQRQP